MQRTVQLCLEAENLLSDLLSRVTTEKEYFGRGYQARAVVLIPAAFTRLRRRKDALTRKLMNRDVGSQVNLSDG